MTNEKANPNYTGLHTTAGNRSTAKAAKMNAGAGNALSKMKIPAQSFPEG